MQASQISIHNFRSIADASFSLGQYSVLHGENNAGKTNIMRALRIFYDDLKFNDESDSPKFETDDSESWIEINFLTSGSEQTSLPDKYKNSDNTLRLRRYLRSEDKKLVKSSQSNTRAVYPSGELADEMFFGAKNVSLAKAGRLIYIPELSRVDESLKMSGPSALRSLVSFVLDRIAKTSNSFTEFGQAIEDFGVGLRSEGDDSFSITKLEQDINEEISGWGVNFKFIINQLQPQEIVKSLVSHSFRDGFLGDEEINIDAFGQGMQRQLVYALIKLTSQYVDDKESPTQKKFSPESTLVLFEEPEAFLHPSQQEIMNASLRTLSKSGGNQQILITTHSPVFISKNIDRLTELIKVSKTQGHSKLFQMNGEALDNLFDQNTGLLKIMELESENPKLTEADRNTIRREFLREGRETQEILESEALKYFLWVDSDRAAYFLPSMLWCARVQARRCFSIT